jgi:hypothetical protein
VSIKSLAAAVGLVAALLLGSIAVAQARPAPGTGCSGDEACRVLREQCALSESTYIETLIRQADGSSVTVGWCQAKVNRDLKRVGVNSCGILKELCITAKGKYTEISVAGDVQGSCKLPPPEPRAIDCNSVQECGVLKPACLSAGGIYYEDTTVRPDGTVITTGTCTVSEGRQG